MRGRLAYLRYVLLHKWYVLLACRRLRVPLWRAIIHDWSKFTSAEWGPYVRTFYNSDGTKKPYVPNAETQEFKGAWNHHQKVNPHHWQYWLLTWDRGETEPLVMPETYVREMVADWIGAGRAISGRTDPTPWYEANKARITLAPATRSLVEQLLYPQRAHGASETP